MLTFCRVVIDDGKKNVSINPKRFALHFIRVWRQNDSVTASKIFVDDMTELFELFAKIKQENDEIEKEEAIKRATEMTVFVDPEDFNAQ